MSVFGEYAHYYNLFYQDKDYEGEAAFVHRILQRHAPHAKHILELGSGTGRHALLLAEKGYTVHGVDRSPAMLEQARERARQAPASIAERLTYHEGDIREVRVKESFDAVISLFHVFSYQTSDEALIAAFDTAAAHLKPGGLLLFDCWYGPAVLAERPAVRIKRLEDEAVSVTRISEPQCNDERNTVDVAYTVFVEDKLSGQIQRVPNECHTMRYLFTPEVETLMCQAGLQTIESGEWMTERPPSRDTFGVYFVGMKSA
ncbi:MAG: class I SAM-dependent methyltransferase [Candidatus Hydrogenedentes bacterium]|nr:class I SAM-dependent methyltransferase [Candidatus Hydrogenedentota bacterium]